MRPGPITLAFLILATVVADLALCVDVRLQNEPPLALAVLAAFVFGQVSLLATWTVLGPGFWLWRYGVLAAGLSACGWLIASTLKESFVQFVSFYSVQAGIVVAASGLLWLAGFRWIDVARGHETYVHNAKRQPFQFSLRDILHLVVLVALALLAAQFADLPSDDADLYVVWAGSTLLTLLAIWATIPPGWRPSRLLVYAIVTISPSVAMSFPLATVRPSEAYFFASFFGLQALFLLVWIGACKLAGYRIVRVYQRSEA